MDRMSISEQIASLLERTDELLQDVQKLKLVMTETVSEPLKPRKKKLNISAKGMESKVAAGRKVSQLNAIRKEFTENARINGEW